MLDPHLMQLLQRFIELVPRHAYGRAAAPPNRGAILASSSANPNRSELDSGEDALARAAVCPGIQVRYLLRIYSILF